MDYGSRVTAFGERAAHSINRMFILSLFLISVVFSDRVLVLSVPVPGHFLPFYVCFFYSKSCPSPGVQRHTHS